MSRLIIVSNRLPVTVHADQGDVSVVPSAGGLVTALRGPHERHGGLWLGWPGDLERLTEEQRREVEDRLDQLGAASVHLTSAEVSRYYDGFSNGVLWPLFHYLVEKLHLDGRQDWESYCEVNERFADAIASRYRPGDRVWIHDYQLTLAPAMLRRRIPDARIGFFLHIPFPAAEVFRILPWREQVLRGMLGADVVGFHTTAYRYHFVYSAARVLGLDPDLETLAYEGRRVRLGAYPVSIDVDEFVRLARDEEVRAEARRIRERRRGRKIVLGVDRLDYTKGIPRRMLAIERFLEREPELRSKVRFIQLAVPTREKVDAYADFRRVVNELVGRINGSYGTLDDVPIHFLHRSMPMAGVVALYLAADVMMVTPLRDGMNLVCKEYVASRIDDTGALVLSEFAGAAAELIEALLVNPHDIDAVASTIQRALVMSPSEQRVRMQALRRRVVTHDAHLLVAPLPERSRARERPPAPRWGRPAAEGAPQGSTIASARSAPSLIVMLDYDGTLVPLEAMPELAQPDEALARRAARARGAPADAGARGERPAARGPRAVAGRAAHQPPRGARVLLPRRARRALGGAPRAALELEAEDPRRSSRASSTARRAASSRRRWCRSRGITGPPTRSSPARRPARCPWSSARRCASTISSSSQAGRCWRCGSAGSTRG